VLAFAGCVHDIVFATDCAATCFFFIHANHDELIVLESWESWDAVAVVDVFTTSVPTVAFMSRTCTGLDVN
jgi:hypothetical protein